MFTIDISLAAGHIDRAAERAAEVASAYPHDSVFLIFNGHRILATGHDAKAIAAAYWQAVDHA